MKAETKEWAKNTYHERAAQKVNYITCELCGETVAQAPQATKNQRVCVSRCKPRPGIMLKCNKCGDRKPYEDFHDYRGAAKERLQRVCKVCQSENGCEYYRKSKER